MHINYLEKNINAPREFFCYSNPLLLTYTLTQTIIQSAINLILAKEFPQYAMFNIGCLYAQCKS